MQRSFFMKRIKILSIFFLAVFISLILRLAYIQILGHEDLSAVTREQALIALEGSNTRGIIYDRYGVPLVADENHYIYIIKDENFTGEAERLLEQMDAAVVSDNNEGYQVYSSEHYDKKIGKKLIEKNNAYILQASARYSDEQTAPHLIGYINRGDLSGAAGLELMYDDRLAGFNRRVYAAADVNGNILPGRGLIITSDAGKDSYVAEGIRTTIDKQLQNEVENIIGEIDNDCAVAVLDCETGGVVAMACTPKFDPNNVGDIINESTVTLDALDDAAGDVLINKVTQGEYPPGSVFKIITAAAALENGIDVDKTYVCTGSIQMDGLSIKCDTGGDYGHGTIGFRDAFAQSCNSYFVQLGQYVGAEKIAETAKKIGLDEKVLDGYPQESSGHVMTSEEWAGNAIGNLSIGQGETLVTPIQVAKMTNIIANRGIDKGVHILMDESFSQVENVDQTGYDQVLSASTAEKIKDMMQLTSENGTGLGLQLVAEDGEAKAAVKTGTAEYAMEDGMHSHGWITGMTPCEDPEYVIVVFVEDGGSGAASAGPVLKKIIEYLERSGSYSMPTLA